MLLPTKRMLLLRFDNEGKSLLGWEVVELIERPWGACQGLWVSQLLSSPCTSPLGGTSPSPHPSPCRCKGKGRLPFLSWSTLQPLLTEPIQAKMSGWGQLIHNFPLFSDFQHYGVRMISVHLIKGYIGKLLSSGVWVCWECFWNTLQGNSLCPLLPLQAM